MMAPIILRQQPPPKDDEDPEDRLEQLEELLMLLDDLMPRRSASAPTAAPETSSLDQTLKRLDERTSALEQRQGIRSPTLEQELEANAILVSRALLKIKADIEALQKRLDELDR
jgi:hypothetical protein